VSMSENNLAKGGQHVVWFESVNEQKVFKKGTKENDDVDEEKIDSVKEYMRRYGRAEAQGSEH
jgi:hypothetical protein